MRSLLKLVGSILMIVAIFACSKSTETGISLKVTGTNSLSAVVGQVVTSKSSAADAEEYNFTEAWLGIKEIEIEIEGEDDHEDDQLETTSEPDHEYDFEGSYLIDLVKGTSSPEIGFKDFTPGRYTNFEAKTARIIDGNKTVLLKGSYTDAFSKNYKFEFSTSAEIEFEYENETGFELTEGNILELIVKINLPSLFASVDFSKGVLNSDNVILINETNNSAIYEIVKSNLRNMAEIEEGDHQDDENKD